MAYDPEVANSSGYFKDPVTKEDLSPEIERVVKCELKDGKFIWPCVLSSDGNQLLKIVYKYFTDEEKDLYKQYRGRPSGGEPRQRKERQVTLRSEVKEEFEPVNDAPKQVIKYNNDSATSTNTLVLLAQCDTCYGVSYINGIMYGLVGKKNDNKIHHIPRSCIPDDEWDRICTGGV